MLAGLFPPADVQAKHAACGVSGTKSRPADRPISSEKTSVWFFHSCLGTVDRLPVKANEMQYAQEEDNTEPENHW